MPAIPIPPPVSVPGAKVPDAMNPMQWPGGTFSRVAAETTFQNSDIVRLEVEEYGVAQGRSEDHGAGQWKKIPKNSLGEVLGTDPTTGWVNCLFTGPCKNNGPMEPHGVTAWIEPQNLSASNTPKPGPAVRRR
jgi:hypothetical protein